MVAQPSVITFPIEDALVKTYKLRRVIPSKNPESRGVQVSVPRDFIHAVARRNNLSYEEFVERCRVVVYYSGGNSLLYQFELSEEENEEE